MERGASEIETEQSVQKAWFGDPKSDDTKYVYYFPIMIQLQCMWLSFPYLPPLPSSSFFQC